MADRSRMTGDCHVRICGSVGVRFPRATRLSTSADPQEVEICFSYLKSELPMSVSLDKLLVVEIIDKKPPTWQPTLLAK